MRIILKMLEFIQRNAQIGGQKSVFYGADEVALSYAGQGEHEKGGENQVSRTVHCLGFISLQN